MLTLDPANRALVAQTRPLATTTNGGALLAQRPNVPAGPVADDRELANLGASGSHVALRGILSRLSGRLRAFAWHMSYDH